MAVSRRGFFKSLGVVGTGVVAGSAANPVLGSTMERDASGDVGVLVDITRCIGCRKCEFACQEAAGFSPPPLDAFDDKSVFDQPRRPYPRSYTVINRYPNPRDPQTPLYAKFNCLHCVKPACVSACLVGALHKQPNGPVVYDPHKCMGCRYCMIACPFEIPSYEYNNPLTPQVRKCNLCDHIVPKQQEVPACVRICPEEVLTYGRRADLLKLAHDRIGEKPERYVDHVYGEHEAGGTSWLWISSIPFEQVGFHQVASNAPPMLTETIQHGVFKHFLPPVMWYALLGAAMWLTSPAADSAGGADHA